MAYQLSREFLDLNDLIASYARPEGLMVDLGCGYYKPEGFIGIDNFIGADTQIKNVDRGPDIIMDINSQRIPLENESCFLIRTSHFLEHSVLDHVFDEVFRLLKPGGTFEIIVPYANSAQGMYPGHTIFLTEMWFQKNLQFQRLFSIEAEEYRKSDIYHSLPFYVKLILPFHVARKILFNVCHEMKLTVKPKKE